MTILANRRDFLKAAVLGTTLSTALAQRKRNLKIGHTGITWPAPQPGTRGSRRPPACRSSLAILDMMEGRQTAAKIMVEPDGTPLMPMTALEAATIAKGYLEEQGVVFRNS